MTQTAENPPATAEQEWRMTDEEIADVHARFARMAVTENDTPVGNIFSEKQMRLLTRPLLASWPGPDAGRTFVAIANVGLFYNLYKPAIVPDALVSVDVHLPDDLWAKHHRSCVMWEETFDGKPPEVVVEIVSNTVGEELGNKLKLYAQIGVLYYIVYDPDLHLKRGNLLIHKLRSRSYALRRDGWMPEVGLGMTLWQGQFEHVSAEWLRWCYQDGTLVPTGEERAIVEAERAEAATQRAERLAAQLRALGVDPDES